MLKVENLIKNTPSRLHHIHQRSGLIKNILQSVKCLWNTIAVSFLAKFIAGCFELGKKMRPGLFQKHYALCNGVLVCISFSRSHVLLILNFFSRLFFSLYREFSNYHFITYLKNPTRLLEWVFLQKQLTTECPFLFFADISVLDV